MTITIENEASSKALVIIEYGDLVKDADLSEQLLAAWGEDGVGVVAIRGVPGWQDQCGAVLGLAHRLARLPAEALAKLEHEGSMYNAGWSYGKEKLGDKPDFAKGSFYFNPLANRPGTEKDRELFPWAMPVNLWPADIPELEPAAMRLGRTMRDTVAHLARLVDRTMAQKTSDYNLELAQLVSETEKCKGRLLYYFPPAVDVAPTESVKEDGWIGWHNDSGFFTALTPDIYVDHDSGEVVDNPDPDGAGLWVVKRDGDSVHVKLPRDCMAVQVGECTQVVTGGMFVATPHCVRGCRSQFTCGRPIARIACPCFIDSHPTFPLEMPKGTSREHVLSKGLSDKVPFLGDRWELDGQSFGDFLGASFRRYYDWALKTPIAA